MTNNSEIHASQNIGFVTIDPVGRGSAAWFLGIPPQINTETAGLATAPSSPTREDQFHHGRRFRRREFRHRGRFIAAGKDIGTIEADAVGTGPGAFGIFNTEIVAGGTISEIRASSSDDCGISATTVHAGKAITSIDGESVSNGEDT